MPSWAPPRKEAPGSWHTRSQEEDGTPRGGGVDLASVRTAALFDLDGEESGDDEMELP